MPTDFSLAFITMEKSGNESTETMKIEPVSKFGKERSIIVDTLRWPVLDCVLKRKAGMSANQAGFRRD